MDEYLLFGEFCHSCFVSVKMSRRTNQSGTMPNSPNDMSIHVQKKGISRMIPNRLILSPFEILRCAHLLFKKAEKNASPPQAQKAIKPVTRK
jgi:hypothetical protein